MSVVLFKYSFYKTCQGSTLDGKNLTAHGLKPEGGRGAHSEEVHKHRRMLVELEMGSCTSALHHGAVKSDVTPAGGSRAP